MTTYAKNLASYTSTTTTPQDQIIPGREAEMKKNNAGGAVFKVDIWTQLDRFLILGTEGGTYYVQEKPLTLDNAKAVQECIKKDGPRVVGRVVEISHAGRARKNDAALFVLAMAAASDDKLTRTAALTALPQVARIGTHLFHFAQFVKNFRGYGRGLRSGISAWYLNQPVDRLALQAVKYQQRDGWSHRDLLRLAHPKTSEEERNRIFKFMVSKDNKLEVDTGNAFIAAYQEIQRLDHSNVKRAVELIRDVNLPREAIPTELLNEPKVWEALLDQMPLTAMIRNLGKMSSLGILNPLSNGAKKVVGALSSTESLQRARIHPMAVIDALKVYARGAGVKGSLVWTPTPQIVDALDDAFYACFDFVEPTGKNLLLGVDCSGSMSSEISGSSVLSCRDAAAVMALVTAKTETNYEIVGFSSGKGWTNSGSKRSGFWGMGSGIKELGISPKMRLDDVVNKMARFDWGGTDASLPYLFATDTDRGVDGFITLTDNETWCNQEIQPAQALKKYRQKSGRAAKGVVVAMTSTDFSIADPKDAGMLDVVGGDTATPSVIADFIRD